jgi:hypothetical protein
MDDQRISDLDESSGRCPGKTQFDIDKRIPGDRHLRIRITGQNKSDNTGAYQKY